MKNVKDSNFKSAEIWKKNVLFETFQTYRQSKKKIEIVKALESGNHKFYYNESQNLLTQNG